MPVPVSMITLTQVVSGTSTVVARAAIGREIPDLKHLALTVDGTTAKVYFRGRLLMVGTLSTTMTIDRVELQGGTKDTLLSEMLLMPRVAEPEDIKTWWNLRAPFYDPSPVVYKDQIPYAGDWDSKNKTYYDPNPPTGASVGDLWVDTDDNDRLYRWDGATWVDITDKSPVDAEKKPVYVKGAGADIDIDKYGIRATRKADGKKTFEIDAETGDAFFKGDITGASGTFQGAVKSVDAEGNYSLLDSGRLSFYRRIGEDDILSYYVAQIATGQAVDGEVVDLAALGYRFFQPPKIVLQPKLNRVFVANAPNNDIWMDWDIEDQSFDPDTGSVTFRVRCRTIVKGGTVPGSFSPNKLTAEGASTVTTTGPGTTYLQFRIGGYSIDTFIFASAKIKFRIQYRKVGASSWTLLDTKTYTGGKHCRFMETLTYNVPDSGGVGYEVRVVLDQLSTRDNDNSKEETPHITIYEFYHRSGDTVLSDPSNPEVVSWIAIDGG